MSARSVHRILAMKAHSVLRSKSRKTNMNCALLILRGCGHVDREARWWHDPFFRSAFGCNDCSEPGATRLCEIPNSETFGLRGSIDRGVESHTGSRGVRSVLRDTLCWAPRPRTWRLSFIVRFVVCGCCRLYGSLLIAAWYLPPPARKEGGIYPWLPPTHVVCSLRVLMPGSMRCRDGCPCQSTGKTPAGWVIVIGLWYEAHRHKTEGPAYP